MHRPVSVLHAVTDCVQLCEWDRVPKYRVPFVQ